MKLLVLLLMLMGSSAKAIINGELVQATDALAQSTVALIFREASGRYYCTGSIIDASHILTAAHCVEDPFLEGTIIFARENVFAKDLPAEAKRTVTGFQIGNGFPGGRALPFDEFNDLAILEFSGGLPEGYKAIPYASPALYPTLVKVNATITVAGIGKYIRTAPPDGKLRKASSVIMSQGLEKYNFWTGANACGGDSGGPAVIDFDGTPILVGVFSRTDPGCLSVSIFTKFTGDVHNGRIKQ